MKENLVIDFHEFVNVFNEEGKNSAKILAKEKYGKSFEFIQRKISKESSYYFNRNLRKYENKDKNIIEAKFMSIDELDSCRSEIKSLKHIEPLTGLSSNSSFDKLVNELIKDRLIELSKYVTIEHGSKNMIINSKAIKNDGYNLVVI